ncbi:MAG TPA: DUF1573 domain-containing protein [Nitrosopumilaceae archaeon]|jgi:hypothetical protein|nr:DUF1573 domain-containing protein [Nitrosopumilaceae archaeon]
MKKALLTISVFCCLVITGKAQEVTTPNIDPNAPELKFDQETIDYGVIDYDGNTLREYKFKNTGKSPLILSNVQVQCGCTNVDGWPKEPIAPGKTATFKVKYDSKRPGKFDKKITVTSNAKNPTVILTIKGEVKPAPVAPTTTTTTTPPTGGK